MPRWEIILISQCKAGHTFGTCSYPGHFLETTWVLCICSTLWPAMRYWGKGEVQFSSNTSSPSILRYISNSLFIDTGNLYFSLLVSHFDLRCSRYFHLISHCTWCTSDGYECQPHTSVQILPNLRLKLRIIVVLSLHVIVFKKIRAISADEASKASSAPHLRVAPSSMQQHHRWTRRSPGKPSTLWMLSPVRVHRMSNATVGLPGWTLSRTMTRTPRDSYPR